MLIEDFNIAVKGKFKKELKVQSFNIVYAVNELSQCTLDIELSEDNSVRYLDIERYRKEEFVGTPLTITWASNNNMLLFSGQVTGIALSKSATSVRYSVKCTGGPLALYNTTLAVSGWYPFGAYDNSEVAERFSDQIIAQKWTTPKELLTILVSILPNSVSFNKETSSSAGKLHLKQVQIELLKDIINIIEAPILKKFFGNVGEFDNFGEVIRKRVGNLVATEMQKESYWRFLLYLCNEIGCWVVPWISKIMIIPNMLFTDSIKTNVIFPSMTQSINLNSDPYTYPDQIVMFSEEGFAENTSNIRELRQNSAVVYPLDKDVEDTFSPYPGNRYLFVNPREYQYLAYIRHESLAKEVRSKNLKSTNMAVKSKEEDPSKVIEGEGTYKKYAENFAQFHYHMLRTKKDYGSVSMVFHPRFVPGFSSYIIDSKTGMNFRAVAMRVTHSVGRQSAGTTVTFSHMLSLSDIKSLNSPLWATLVPSGADTGSILKAEGLGDEKNHVPFSEDLLDPKKTPANVDERQAAIYTGRISK